jgi:hypothetical protein
MVSLLLHDRLVDQHWLVAGNGDEESAEAGTTIESKRDLTVEEEAAVSSTNSFRVALTVSGVVEAVVRVSAPNRLGCVYGTL